MTKRQLLNLSIKLLKDKNIRLLFRDIDNHFRQSIAKPHPLSFNYYRSVMGLTFEEFKCILKIRGYKTGMYEVHGTPEVRFKPY